MTHALTEARLVKDPGETRENVRKKARESEALRTKASKLENEIATLRDALHPNEKKIAELESQKALDAKPIAHLATIVKEHLSSSLCVAAENGQLRRRVNVMKEKALPAGSSGERPQKKISATTRERNALVAKCEEFTLEVYYMPGLAEEAKCLHARVVELEEASKRNTLRTLAKRWITDMKVVPKETYTELAHHTVLIAQLEGDLHVLKGKLDRLDRRNDVIDSQNSIVSDECDSLKR